MSVLPANEFSLLNRLHRLGCPQQMEIFRSFQALINGEESLNIVLVLGIPSAAWCVRREHFISICCQFLRHEFDSLYKDKIYNSYKFFVKKDDVFFEVRNRTTI